MAARLKMIEKELDNRMATIVWDDIAAAIAALSPLEKDLCVSDIKNIEGSAGALRQVVSKQVRQNIRSAVVSDVDGYIASGSVPVAFINKILD